ncbi:PARP6_8 [Mytilus edulis]|uniref:PARP6_8 n=1 Tax=Mytilus edulis TaxID=6550 RepID=A0A8S3SHW5_MYTED|nr:PARP6_8 [Mytilus edulis]
MEAKWHKTCRNKYTEMTIERHENIKRKLESGSEETSGKITRQSIGCSTVTMTHDCFFCGESSGELHKHLVLTATKAAKICYAEDAKEDNQFHGIVLAELVAYIEDSRMNTEVATIFRLADLLNMYTNRLEQFGIDTSKRLNSTHLKDRILAAIPDLEAHKQGRDVLLIFNEDIGKAIKQALASNYDDEAIILSKAVKIVRKDMMETKSSFKGFSKLIFKQIQFHNHCTH